MVEQIFLSPQVKRSVIISNKCGIYELPHELPNDLRLKILRKNLKISQNYSPELSSPQNENFVNTRKKLLKNRNCTFPVVRCFT